MVLLVATVACGCKRESAPHPAQEPAEAFLDALKYGDLDRAADRHIDATSEGFYCGSEKFERALQKAKEARSQAECERVEKLGEAQLGELEPEARFIVQLVRFACEEPESGCADYGRRVVESRLNQLARSDSASRWAVADYRIQRVLGGDGEAVVYVDLFSKADAARATHATIGMREIGGEWVVTEPLRDEKTVDMGGPRPD
ncbi:MAG: hypothetical protein ACOC9W_00215 [Persicimonas sp.]